MDGTPLVKSKFCRGGTRLMTPRRSHLSLSLALRNFWAGRLDVIGEALQHHYGAWMILTLQCCFVV